MSIKDDIFMLLAINFRLEISYIYLLCLCEKMAAYLYIVLINMVLLVMLEVENSYFWREYAMYYKYIRNISSVILYEYFFLPYDIGNMYKCIECLSIYYEINYIIFKRLYYILIILLYNVHICI